MVGRQRRKTSCRATSRRRGLSKGGFPHRQQSWLEQTCPERGKSSFCISCNGLRAWAMLLPEISAGKDRRYCTHSTVDGVPHRGNDHPQGHVSEAGRGRERAAGCQSRCPIRRERPAMTWVALVVRWLFGGWDSDLSAFAWICGVRVGCVDTAREDGEGRWRTTMGKLEFELAR